ncbi:Protein TED1 [Penicillium rolfsii]|nr:Protein TED1 [Penicillium rolfsii]
MFLRALLSRAFTLLLPLTLAASVYLYLYPVLNGCGFPLPPAQSATGESVSIASRLRQNVVVNTFLQHIRTPDATSDNQPAIFRLLVLADPQLEGDSSLPLPDWKLVPRMRTHWRAVQEAFAEASTTTPLPKALLDQNVLDNITTGVKTFVTEDVTRSFRATVKQVDLFGNDYYLAHIYRTLFWWTRPTHTTVLGDLLGSQWIDNEEFSWRSTRFWTRVFRGAERVDDHLTSTGALRGDQGHAKQQLESLGPEADPAWPRRIINVAGNHDIGYAGDISKARIERFEREFGRADWDIRFEHPPVSRGDNHSDGSVITPTLHLINLNTLLFDTPALDGDLQTRSYSYLNDLISERLYPVEDRSTFTLLLTHLPMHKEDGICTDGPYFTFHDEDDSEGLDGVPRWKSGGLREQNHLSDHISASGILQGIFGLSGDENAAYGGYGRKGLILTGHDHTGCDVIHYINRTAEITGQSEGSSEPQNWKWAAKRFNKYRPEKLTTPSIREVTLRAMMGEFGGNAGLLSAWFDASTGEWDYEIVMCPAGVQHIWWTVHVLILVTVIVGLLGLVTKVMETETGELAMSRTTDWTVSKSEEEEPIEKRFKRWTPGKAHGDDDSKR